MVVWYRLYLCSEGIEGDALFNELHSGKHVFQCAARFIICHMRQLGKFRSHICFRYSLPFTAVSLSLPQHLDSRVRSILCVFFHHSSCPGDRELWVNDERWWMKLLSPLLPDETDGLTTVWDVLFVCCPFYATFILHAITGWNELTETQTLAAIQLKDNECRLDLFFNHLTLFYLHIIQQHHNEWKALQPWALNRLENCLYCIDLYVGWKNWIHWVCTTCAYFPMIWTGLLNWTDVKLVFFSLYHCYSSYK